MTLQFVGINSKNARGILKHRMKQKEERNNVMKKANETVVLCGASAYEEKYYLNPDDYTKKADGTASDVSNANFAGNAMAVIKKIYKKEYKVGSDRYVYFCER